MKQTSHSGATCQACPCVKLLNKSTLPGFSFDREAYCSVLCWGLHPKPPCELRLVQSRAACVGTGSQHSRVHAGTLWIYTWGLTVWCWPRACRKSSCPFPGEILSLPMGVSPPGRSHPLPRSRNRHYKIHSAIAAQGLTHHKVQQSVRGSSTAVPSLVFCALGLRGGGTGKVY